VFPKIFLLHKVVRDAKKVEKHCSSERGLSLCFRGSIAAKRPLYNRI